MSILDLKRTNYKKVYFLNNQCYSVTMSLLTTLKEGGGLNIDTIGNLPIDEDINLIPDIVNFDVNFLVVAGGGGGGTQIPSVNNGGGGGAGGLQSSVTSTGGGGSLLSAVSLTTGTDYTVTIGAGGAVDTQGSSSVLVITHLLVVVKVEV